MGLFSGTNVLSIFMAFVLWTEVAPHVALTSRPAGLALKLGAVALGLSVASGFLGMFLFRFNLPPELALNVLPQLSYGVFWACLAWAVLALMQGAGPKGVA